MSPGGEDGRVPSEKGKKYQTPASSSTFTNSNIPSSDASDEDRQQRLNRKGGTLKDRKLNGTEEDDDSDNINVDKLQTIRNKAAER